MTGKYWQDIDNMRESVSMETTAMAKKKLLMNYYWWVNVTSNGVYYI